MAIDPISLTMAGLGLAGSVMDGLDIGVIVTGKQIGRAHV